MIFFILGFFNNKTKRLKPKETVIRAGIVPKPKNSIMVAPLNKSPLAIDHVSVEYTKPQGNQPHIAPKPNAFRLLLTGITYFVNGDKLDQRYFPKDSTRLSHINHWPI